jgi:hypothetical protein
VCQRWWIYGCDTDPESQPRHYDGHVLLSFLFVSQGHFSLIMIEWVMQSPLHYTYIDKSGFLGSQFSSALAGFSKGGTEHALEGHEERNRLVITNREAMPGAGATTPSSQLQIRIYLLAGKGRKMVLALGARQMDIFALDAGPDEMGLELRTRQTWESGRGRRWIAHGCPMVDTSLD